MMRTRVLLVIAGDDDAAQLSRLLLGSRRLELDIERAPTLAAARALLGRSTYDVVAMELDLPDSHGLATLGAILAAAGGAASIVLTGDEDLGRRAVDLGADEYVATSEGRESLPMAISFVVERARREDGSLELTTALASTFDAIATLDGSGAFLAVNAAFQALLGFAPQEVAGRPWIELVHEADRPRVEGIRSRRAGSDALELRMVAKDERVVFVQLAIVARQGGRGHFWFLRDLTTQKQAESSVAAAAAATAVGSLAAGIAHEVNNPLSVLLANLEEGSRIASEVALSVPGPMKTDVEDLRSMFDEALSAAQRVHLVVRDLRAFSSADDRRARVDVDQVIEACCNVAAAELRHRARLVKDLRAGIPVRGSEARLAQVLLGLLLNAAQAMPEGELGLNEIRVTTRRRDRDWVVIEIADNGAGIAPAHVGLVFEPFFTTRPRRPGMGLAICQATVADHGGEISIRPRDGGGTVVCVVLPTIEAELAPELPGPRGRPKATQGRLLVVDDDPLVLRSLTRVLARDFEVASARNGREALDLVQADGPFDAMLCDLVMPELSGIELHERLVRDAPDLAKRTVFLTGGANARQRTRLAEVGQPHLEKPVDVKTVREMLLRISGATAGRRSNGERTGGG